MSKLCILDGEMAGLCFDLAEGISLIGRAPDNHIQIRDRSVSRVHTKIHRKGERYFIEDLNSRNGTWINGQPVRPGCVVELEQGIPFVIGRVLSIVAKEALEEGPFLKYAVDVADRNEKENKGGVYKERRITSRRNLQLIYEVSNTLMQSLEVDHICEKIMDSLFSTLERIDAGAILWKDDQSGELKEIVTRSRDREKGPITHYSKTVVNRVIREGKALVISDTRFEDMEDLSDSIELLKIKSIMCVPLISKSRTRGVIYVHSVDVPHGFREEDLYLLSGLSCSAALAIENGLLYREARLASEALKDARDQLERRVEERSAELMRANEQLQREIAERQQTEKALRESEAKYRQLVQNAPTAIFELDVRKFRFTKVNDVLLQFLGYDEQEFLGMDPAELVAVESRELLAERIQKVRSGEAIPEGVEYKVKRKDGQDVWALVNTRFFYEDGRPVRAIGVAQDITERKRLEEQLQQAQKMEAIGTLAGGIAHDFNNLLMGIQGNASLMLLGKDASHPDHEKLKNIEEYVQNGADLTKRLLGFARGGKYAVKPTDLNQVLGRSAELFGRTRKEIKIHAKYQEDIWAVEVDRGQMEQVLLNLFVNAWKAMPGGGELYLQTENVTLDEGFVRPYRVEPGRFVRLSVMDTGVGMDPKTKERIFDPFFTTKPIGRGTGLGLASVYGIIKNHGGIIEARSRLGEGTTFDLYIPASEKGLAEKEEPREQILRGHEMILFVDDEEMIVEVGEKLLQEMGYQVLLARSGQEAIERYRAHKGEIHMVILDMIMPDMGGGETFDRLREVDKGVKVLLSSGYSLDGQAREILDRGCNGFIQKPFNLKDLSRKVRKILDEK